MNHRLITTLTVLLCLSLSVPVSGRDPEKLQIMKSGYPRVFFFRGSEGPPSSSKPDYDSWNADFSRLMGIMGKCLDEEVIGRQKNNPAFFSRFKREHPEQVVLLHFNGNARDPRYEAENFHAGHWIYRIPADIQSDVAAEPGDTDIKVNNTKLFRVNSGRYRTSNDDIALFRLKADGTYDWEYCEQVQLVSIDAGKGTIRVRRGQYGTRPLAFRAGISRAAPHQVEGPWGNKNHIMWYYNYSTHCPKDRDGKNAADRVVEHLAKQFGKGGLLEALDGLEFDVLFSRTHGDTDGDGVEDNGVIDNVNRYSIGVVDFIRKLRDQLGNDCIIQADGALGPGGERSQRCWGLLNGIESEGWPDLRDWEVEEWSGGLNRHNYWQLHGRKPVFNYVNHKYTQGVEGEPGETEHPDVGFNIHRLVFAACCFTDAMICYAFPPPAEARGRLGIWDEFICGKENRLGWLGMPIGPAVHLAAQSPDLLNGKGHGKTLVSMITGPVIAKDTPRGVHLTAEKNATAGTLNFNISDICTSGGDLTAIVTMKGEPMAGYPGTVARFTRVGISTGIQLISDENPTVGICLRGQPEKSFDPESGAWCQHKKIKIGDDDIRNSLAVHPPYKGATGYIYWSKDVMVPPDSDLCYDIGMGERSPAKSDGVWFSVSAAVIDNGQLGAYKKLKETPSKEHKWISNRISLADFAGKIVRLKFIADCGPNDKATTDQAYWSNVAILARGRDVEDLSGDGSFMTWTGTEPFNSSFYYRNIKAEKINMNFSVEGLEPVTIQSITLHNRPDAMFRLFRNGIVLANPGLKPFTFDLSEIAPGQSYRRIKGTAKQDPETNNGEPVGKTVTLAPRDGLMLIAENFIRQAMRHEQLRSCPALHNHQICRRH